MSQSLRSADGAKTYAFRFDAPIAARVFGDEYDLSGWLLHPGGKPINGIRAVVKRTFARRQIFPARRKRDRPDVSAAFPHLSDAKASGFLLELRLGFGTNTLTLQVLDHERKWRTFHTATVWVFPFSLLRWLRFSNLRRFLISRLQANYSQEDQLREHGARTAQIPVDATTVAAITTKRVELFATTKSNLFILEIGELVAAGFRELGCEAELLLDQIPQASPPPGTVQLVITPHEYYNLFLTERLSHEEATKLTRNLVLLCTEQPETGWFHSNLQWATHACGVVDINPLGVLAYRARGTPAEHLQLGYHPVLSHGELIEHPRRNYDITFLGCMTPRRDAFFAEYAPFFAAHRCHLRFVPLDFAKTKVTRSYLSSERRNALLSRSRILLNLHYSDRKYFEWHRFLIGSANGCCVISETSEGYAPLLPGKHFIMAEREDLIACCDYYLRHPAECAAVAREASEFVQTHLRQAQVCRTFLQKLEAAGQKRPEMSNGADLISTARLSPDKRAIAAPRELDRAIARRRMRLLKRALADDFRNWFASSLPTAGDSTESMDNSIGDRAAVVEKRQAFKVRWTEQESRLARGEPVWEFHDNPAYSLAPTPQLSVVITLFNYPDYIRDCLTSIGRAAETLREPLEIVIVNDASTDNSLAEAIRFQAASRLPTRIIDKRFNTGLADARNVGVRHARAPYVFMMDADNLLFREGLGQLLETIQLENKAAAYSLLCRFKGSPANRVGLLSYFDWDPQILVQHPYIDAMAMFRRDVLLELGGYDDDLSQVGWFGWEDYDMWLRFAQHDYPVGFVPNVLCLYRHHDTSMINVTNLFETELVQHFLERYAELVARFEPRETLFGIERGKIAASMAEKTGVADRSAALITTQPVGRMPHSGDPDKHSGSS